MRRSPWLDLVAVAALALLVMVTGAPRGDFANYYTAARLVVEGVPLDPIYDMRWFTEQASRVGFGDQLVNFTVLPLLR